VTRTPAPRARRIHLIGIGGSGMSGLARLAVQAGYQVSGSDRERSPVVDDLSSLGVQVTIGHSADAIPAHVETVVISTAISADNPEYREAVHREIPVVHRAELLVELMDGSSCLAIAGAHGKSTTSGMLLAALGDASGCVGATVAGGNGTGALWGTSEWFVAEADESDRSLLRFSPAAAVLLNVDHDHHTTYASLEEVEEVFAAFLARVPATGLVVAGPDDRAQSLARASGREVRVIGESPDAWARILERHGGHATLHMSTGQQITLALQVPGRHNIENAACALAVADWCGVDLDVAAARLATFTGVGRRFELRGVAGGVTVIDDYAHHPAEVRATLSAARERATGRVIAIFQPHLYSRTRELCDEFAAALAGADRVYVTEIYAAREDAIAGVSGRDIVDRLAESEHAEFVPELDAVVPRVVNEARDGDLVLTLGAGDITRIGNDLVQGLHERSAQRAGHGE